MTQRAEARASGRRCCGWALFALLSACGCRTGQPVAVSERELGFVIDRYRAAHAEQLSAAPHQRNAAGTGLLAALEDAAARQGASAYGDAGTGREYVALGMFPALDEGTPQSRPATTRPGGVPDGYWRDNVWDQAGAEFTDLITRDFWRGFKTSFWDVENALFLTAAMGASITIRETGVDETVRSRVDGHRQLGDLDETIQILGNPGTHFAATGVLWLTSTLTQDAEQHEVAQALTQALAVNGVTTLALKAAANTRAPDGERHAWPSGHTSSTFTVAAVLNEYYGPWVGVPSFALAGLVGYQRIDSRVHDFSDVVFGAVLGYVVGTSIARDEKAQFPEIFGMQVVPYADPQTGASGIALMKQF